MIYLFAKIGIIIAIVFILFTFMYGVFRCSDVYMKPAIQDGDLVFYYRLDKDYIAGDVIVYKLENGHITTGRVMAVAGDTVDIDDEGILVNGSYQTETDINEKTNRFEGGIDFPLTVGEGQVFILGDKRTQATDSRIIGCIDNSATGGKVMGLFRRRNF